MRVDEQEYLKQIAYAKRKWLAKINMGSLRAEINSRQLKQIFGACLKGRHRKPRWK